MQWSSPRSVSYEQVALRTEAAAEADCQTQTTRLARKTKMMISKSYTAKIYVGFRAPCGVEKSINDARCLCYDYCNEVGLCVTIDETIFIYTGGSESGCVVGLIQYPRFPVEERVIQRHAIALATRLMKAYDQQRVSIVFPDATVTLETGRYDEQMAYNMFSWRLEQGI